MAASTHPVNDHALTRRGALTLAAAATTAAVAGPAYADDGRHGHRDLPDTVALPDGLQPEGITSGPGATFYVGSVSDGRIVTGDLLGTGTTVLLPAATGRSLRGLFHDRHTGLVWAVGGLGADAHVWAVDDSTGAVVADVLVPGGGFLNDLVITERAVWVTDSFVDRLARIALDRRGLPRGIDPTFLALGVEWPDTAQGTFGANGIRELDDGSLVINRQHRRRPVAREPANRRDPRDRGARGPAAGQW